MFERSILNLFVMNVIVFGANGRVGSQVVKRALEKGHKVTAFVRHSETVTLLHPNLTVAQGDAMRQQDVTAHLKGQQAVISALSSNELSHRLVFINHIINSMREHKVRRIIAIGGIGALQASEHLKVYETTTFPPLPKTHKHKSKLKPPDFRQFLWAC